MSLVPRFSSTVDGLSPSLCLETNEQNTFVFNYFISSPFSYLKYSFSELLSMILFNATLQCFSFFSDIPFIDFL